MLQDLDSEVKGASIKPFSLVIKLKSAALTKPQIRSESVALRGFSNPHMTRTLEPCTTKRELRLLGFRTSEVQDFGMLEPQNIQIPPKATFLKGDWTVDRQLVVSYPLSWDSSLSLNPSQLFFHEVTRVVDPRNINIFLDCWIKSTIKFNVDLLWESEGVKWLESLNVEVMK
jgi:hypothetical protein